MKIVAIAGSPRVDGNTSYLIDQALSEAGSLGVETEKIVLSECQIAPCQSHDECGSFASCPQEDDAELALRKLYEADGVILASPVYYYNVTAQLKAFIDRNIFYYRRRWKMKAGCAGIIVVAGGAGIEDTANAMIRFITISSNVAADKVIRVHGLSGLERTVKENTALVEQARRLGRDMAQALLAGG